MAEQEEDSSARTARQLAQQFKAQGNEAFKQERNEDAINLYTQAIELDPDDHVYYSNRSAAYLKVGGSKSKALKDAECCIKLRPDWPKGYNRLGAAQYALGRFDEALATYRRGLEIDPQSSALQAALRTTEQTKIKADERNAQATQARAEADDRRQADARRNAEKQAMANMAAAAVLGDAWEGEGEEEELPAAVAGGSSSVAQPQSTASTDAVQSVESDLMADFFSEITDLEQKQNTTTSNDKALEEEKLRAKRANMDLGTGEQQIARLLRPGHTWFNLNPFEVLQLDREASQEEMKQRYRKLSTLVHPDKCTDSRASDAFDEVKKAYDQLKLDDRRNVVIQLIKKAEQQCLMQRKRLLRKGLTQAQLVEREGEEHEALDKAVKKMFADVERRRRSMEKHQQAHKAREADALDAEQEKLKKEYEHNKSWNKEERVEKRVGSWRDFDKRQKRHKGSSSWTQEQSSSGPSKVDTMGAQNAHKQTWK
eukprot:g303.t1